MKSKNNLPGFNAFNAGIYANKKLESYKSELLERSNISNKIVPAMRPDWCRRLAYYCMRDSPGSGSGMACWRTYDRYC